MSETFQNRYIRYIIFTLIPVVLFITAYYFKEAGGPYYLNYYDPGYVYLVNSINIMEFKDIGHTDHPGTPVQIFGAVILKIMMPDKSDEQILETVFSDPEYYLYVLNKALVIINCLALYFLGLFIYSKTSNLPLSLLIQLSPFISTEILYGLVIVSPENFLILSSLCLIALLFYIVYNNDSDKHMLALSFISALICGFGTVSKLNFLPVCLLPLLVLKGAKYKLVYTSGAILVFLILFSPAFSKLSQFTAWAGNLIFNTGIHGHTELQNFSLQLYISNIAEIFSRDIFFTAIYLLIILVLILSLFLKSEYDSKKKEIMCKKERKVLFALMLTITFQILVVAKNYMPYAQYYIIPSLMLSITGLAFLMSFSLRSFKIFQKAKPAKAFTAAFVIVALFSVFETKSSIVEASEFRDESIKVNNIVKDYSKNGSVIPSVGTANKDCALALCVMFDYSGKRKEIYKKVFSKKSSSVIFHDFWKNKLFALSDSIDINNFLSGKKRVVFQLMSVTTIDMIIKMLKEDYNIVVKDWELILKNENQESVYEVYL